MINYNITGKDIKKLVTRFQYKKTFMRFEILLKLDKSVGMVTFLRTDDYGEFKKVFDELMTIRSENRMLQVSLSEGNSGLGQISAA